MTEPLVSVIVATYGGDRLDYLRDALRSILNQTYERIELIVVSDGPVAVDAGAFLESLAREDSRVRLASLEENRGPACARNLGLKEAAGEYVAILDADDIAHEDRIERQVRFIEEHQAHLVGSCYRIIDEHGELIGRREMPLGLDAVKRWAFILNPIANSTVLARASLMKEHPFPEGQRYGEDYALWVSLLGQGYTLLNHEAYLVDFRSEAGFISRRRGIEPFTTDLITKCRCLAFHPFYIRPLLLLVVMLVSFTRLIPPQVLAIAYRLRARMRFRAT